MLTVTHDETKGPGKPLEEYDCEFRIISDYEADLIKQVKALKREKETLAERVGELQTDVSELTEQLSDAQIDVQEANRAKIQYTKKLGDVQKREREDKELLRTARKAKKICLVAKWGSIAASAGLICGNFVFGYQNSDPVVDIMSFAYAVDSGFAQIHDAIFGLLHAIVPFI